MNNKIFTLFALCTLTYQANAFEFECESKDRSLSMRTTVVDLPHPQVASINVDITREGQTFSFLEGARPLFDLRDWYDLDDFLVSTLIWSENNELVAFNINMNSNSEFNGCIVFLDASEDKPSVVDCTKIGKPVSCITSEGVR